MSHHRCRLWPQAQGHRTFPGPAGKTVGQKPPIERGRAPPPARSHGAQRSCAARGPTPHGLQARRRSQPEEAKGPAARGAAWRAHNTALATAKRDVKSQGERGGGPQSRWAARRLNRTATHRLSPSKASSCRCCCGAWCRCRCASSHGQVASALLDHIQLPHMQGQGERRWGRVEAVWEASGANCLRG